MDNINNKERELSDQECHDLRLAYDKLIEAIKTSKNIQWSVTRYVLLLVGAIIALKKLFGEIACIEKSILFISTIILGLMGSYCLYSFQKDVTNYRDKAEKVQNKLSKPFRDAIPTPQEYTGFSYKIQFLFLFYGTIWAGVIFAGWFIYRV
jgi:hypothetical protein